jgi:ubiquinone/menaquinone biosynthesis C-methylase UbiE
MERTAMAQGRGAELDRYKASSMRAYNEKLLDRYDTAIALRVLRPSQMDDFVVGVLGPYIRELEILDLGCATGRLLERLAAAGAVHLAGSDLAPRIVDAARRRLARFDVEVDLQSADAETNLPWEDDSFDVVTVTGVIHHFYAPDAAIREMRRVLRPSGRLVIVDACFFPPVREFFNLCLKVHPHEGDCYFRTAAQLTGLLQSLGWVVRRCERISWWAFGVVAGPVEAGGALAN